MAKLYLLDLTVGAFGAVLSGMTLVTRWGQFTRWHGLTHLVAGLLFAAIPAFSLGWPRLYTQQRETLLVLIKTLGILVRGRAQVRLNQPPSGKLARDLVSSFVGLRLLTISLAGLLHTRWTVWMAQQGALFAALANLDADCKSELLSHPAMGDAFSTLHSFMESVALPQLHAPLGGLVPKTQLGQCKAAVVFVGPILCILCPALLLLPPPPTLEEGGPGRGRGDHAPRDGLGWMDSRIEQLLRVLRFQGGEAVVAPWSLIAWWLLLVVLWLLAVLAFR